MELKWFFLPPPFFQFYFCFIVCHKTHWSDTDLYILSVVLIPEWVRKQIPIKMWDDISSLFPNFNVCAVEVWEWISNFIPHFIIGIIIWKVMWYSKKSRKRPTWQPSVRTDFVRLDFVTTNRKNGLTWEQLAVGTDSQPVNTGPSRMFSVLTEGCQVGYSREFVGTVTLTDSRIRQMWCDLL